MTDKDEIIITEEMNQTMIRVWHKFSAILSILLAIVAGHNIFLFAILGENVKIIYYLCDIALMIFCILRVKNDYLKDVLKLALTPCMFLGLFIGITKQTETQNAYIILGALAALVFVAIVFIIWHDATKKK